MGKIGIIANPASGKDVRRLVARASVFDNQEKQAIVRRALVGMSQTGPHQVAFLDDDHGIVRGALAEVGGALESQAVADTQMGNALDTIAAARALEAAECDVVMTLGGDGTNRAVAIGWRDVPVIPISTGTNNVFPVLTEATVAGAAAGIIASGVVSLEEVAAQHKLVQVAIEDEREDLALIDAVVSNERFVGARALLEPDQLRMALLTRADPAAVGITSIGGLLAPLSDREECGLLLELGGEAQGVDAPIAPGFYRRVGVTNHRVVSFGEKVTVQGPGILAFDGERERVLKPSQNAAMSLSRSGPRVVDVEKTMHLAAEKGCFKS
ncbi:MAG: ATP-NAD kinase [Gammaproteobacteria bacterium]|nr:ATP-NAD kinase [Gammaproteobacteria bacterium]|tara:strand:+ start:1580 stop:2557 length:978 start_codon:yes stop_codon:yes gene_type:complete